MQDPLWPSRLYSKPKEQSDHRTALVKYINQFSFSCFKFEKLEVLGVQLLPLNWLVVKYITEQWLQKRKIPRNYLLYQHLVWNHQFQGTNTCHPSKPFQYWLPWVLVIISHEGTLEVELKGSPFKAKACWDLGKYTYHRNGCILISQV